jgi:anaerobic magnesium-protoporphyrin IX monomethyl ester cyclase
MKTEVQGYMKIVLINPPLKNLLMGETPKFVTEDRGYNPPMGLIWIATCINQNPRHTAKVLDSQVEELDYDQIKEYIKKEQPDVVGIAAITFTLLDSLFCAKMVKEADPNIKIVFGGPHATLFPNETIEQEIVDYVLAGEGEINFPNFLDGLEDDKDLQEIPGLYFRKDGQIKAGPTAKVIEDLDTLPIPDRTLTPYKKYSSVLAHANPLSTAVTSRGCPFRCTFCDRPQMGGKSFRSRSAKLVVDEMEECKKLGINEIMFYDDTFTMIMPRAKEICEEILERRLDIKWDCRTRVDRVTPDLVKLMQKAGCVRINFGVESGTDKGLAAVRKEVTLDKVKDAFDMCRKLKMETLAYFMIGLPEETKEEMLETIKFAKKVRPNFLHFTVMTPFPETEIWRNMIQKGDMRAVDAWKNYAKNPTKAFDPPTCNMHLTKEQLFEVCTLGYRAFYFRPKYILKELSRVRSFGELFRKAKAGIKVITST